MTSELCLPRSVILSQPLRSVPVPAFISAWQALIWMHKRTLIPCGKIINWAVLGLLCSQLHVCVCAAGNHGDDECVHCPTWGYGFQIHDLLLLGGGPYCLYLQEKTKSAPVDWLIDIYLSIHHLFSSNKYYCVCMCVFRHHDKEVPMYFLIREFYRKNNRRELFFFSFCSLVMTFSIRFGFCRVWQIIMQSLANPDI